MNLEICKEVLKEQADREHLLQWRYPWFNVAYNWLVAILGMILVASLICWSVDVHTQRKADQMAAVALAEYQAEQARAEQAKARELAAQQESEAAIMERQATAIAKAFYGIRNFVDKYNYTADDLKTYARCVFNRVDAGVNSLEAVIGQKDQFLGYAETNPVLQEFYDVAIEAVEEWHSETVKPCDSSYRFAELTERGIYLVNEFGADGYVQRWHA